jgi:hypothetical protein
METSDVESCTSSNFVRGCFGTKYDLRCLGYFTLILISLTLVGVCIALIFIDSDVNNIKYYLSVIVSILAIYIPSPKMKPHNNI